MYPDSKSRRGRVQTRGRVCPTIAVDGEISQIERAFVDLSTNEPKIKEASNCIRTAQRGIDKRDNKETGILEQIAIDLTNKEPKIKDITSCISAGHRGIHNHAGEETGVIEIYKGLISGADVINPIRASYAKCGGRNLIRGDKDGYKLDGVIETERTTAKKLAFLNYRRIDSVDENIAKTLTARDYKGFNTGFETQNGVIETLNGAIIDDTNEGYGNVKVGHYAPTLRAGRNGLKTLEPSNIENKYRIRKLTPLECLRLMDLTDEEALKMLAVNSETQCYKQAGNSIVVSVMVYIFKNLFLGGSEKESRQIDIFDIL